ncbi:MAG: hypothetical protein AB3N21_21150 [Ruegeria sp.]|uniref:hypothetical protein n=1 Tax=Ruegeria sp. TaxID=1879320 RepID=UPI00349EDC02
MARTPRKQPKKTTTTRAKRPAAKARKTAAPTPPPTEAPAAPEMPPHTPPPKPDLNAAMEESYRQLQSIYDAFTRHYTDAGAQYQRLSEQGYRPELADLYREFTETRGAEIAQEGLQLAIRYAASAQALSKRYTDELFFFLQHKGLKDPTVEEPQQSNGLILRGEAGSTLATSFDVENSLATSVSPRVSPTPILDADGNSLDGAMVDIIPDLLNLAPGQKQTVTVHVPLDAELYEAGNTYSSALVIVGLGNGRDQLISMQIEVT